jgi:hypothetical protein
MIPIETPRSKEKVDITDDLTVEGKLLIRVTLENGWSGEGIYFTLHDLEDNMMIASITETGGDEATEVHIVSCKKRRPEALLLCLSYLEAKADMHHSSEQYMLAVAMVCSDQPQLRSGKSLTLVDDLEIGMLSSGESSLDILIVEAHLNRRDVATLKKNVDQEWLESLQVGSEFRNAIERELN